MFKLYFVQIVLMLSNRKKKNNPENIFLALKFLLFIVLFIGIQNFTHAFRAGEAKN